MTPQILLSSEIERDEIPRWLEENLPSAEKALGELLSEVWPQWTDWSQVQISVTFMSAEAMAELNEEYRQVQGPTDVLSFPLWERPSGEFQPPSGMEVLLLGDVVICPDVVRDNAKDHGCSVFSELALVLIHSVLHLLTWDHDSAEREQKMWEVQERYRDRMLDEGAGKSGAQEPSL